MENQIEKKTETPISVFQAQLGKYESAVFRHRNLW